MQSLAATHCAVETERRRRLIKLPELMARTALSRSEVYRRIRDDPTFPKPAKLGVRSIAFVDAEVEDYIRSCIAVRDAKAAAA